MDREIVVDVDGTPYTGSFEVSKGVVTVSTAFSRESAQIGGMDAVGLAKVMLSDMVREEIKAGLHKPA